MPVTTRKRSSYEATSHINGYKSIKLDTKTEPEVKSESSLPDTLQATGQDLTRISVKHNPSTKTGEMSWYEKLRESNLKANAEFLASLNIAQVKNDLRSASSSHIQRTGPSKRGIKVDATPYIEPRQYQLRPRGKKPPVADVTSSDVLISLPVSRPKSSYKATLGKSTSKRGVQSSVRLYRTEKRQARDLSECLSWDDICANQSSADPDGLTKRANSDDHRSCTFMSTNYKEFLDQCKSMCISEDLVAKVTPMRIFSIAIHPRVNESPLIAAGDKWGYLGFWNVNTGSEEFSPPDDGVTLFKPHTSPVNCLEFSPHDNHLLYSVSYDGTLRRCDINQQVFTLSYNTPEKQCGLLYLDYLDTHTVSVAQYDGSVAFVDDRDKKPSVYQLNGGKLKAVSFHPVLSDYFLTGSVQGNVDLYDRRYIKAISTSNKCIGRVTCNRGILSAYFSPLTGNKILTCSSDDTVRVYNSSDFSNLRLDKTIKHNNYTGRWVTNFRANWHPVREDCFLIGSMKQPRQIELYSITGNLAHRYTDNNQHLSCITSVHAFHPKQPVLAGANSSGRVYVFSA